MFWYNNSSPFATWVKSLSFFFVAIRNPLTTWSKQATIEVPVRECKNKQDWKIDYPLMNGSHAHLPEFLPAGSGPGCGPEWWSSPYPALPARSVHCGSWRTHRCPAARRSLLCRALVRKWSESLFAEQSFVFWGLPPRTTPGVKWIHSDRSSHNRREEGRKKRKWIVRTCENGDGSTAETSKPENVSNSSQQHGNETKHKRYNKNSKNNKQTNIHTQSMHTCAGVDCN